MDLKRLNVLLLGGFYIFAGINHFINPAFYLPIIPDYIPFPEFVNYGSGVAEVLLGAGVWISRTRKLSSVLILILLIAFIPAHVHFIQIGSCIEGGLCTPEWLGWLRLVLIHPLLMLWAWSVRNEERPLLQLKRTG